MSRPSPPRVQTTEDLARRPLAPSSAAGPWLVADIGGTNARFALYAPGCDPAEGPLAHAIYATGDFPGPTACMGAFLRDHGSPDVEQAALALAAPLQGDEIALTNAGWRFSLEELRRELGFRRLATVNDFAALAHALPLLGPRDRWAFGPDRPAAPDRPIVVLGPGTGLGVAAAVPDGRGGWSGVAGEGGHATAAAAIAREAAVLEVVRERWGHVSYERVASGPGLCELAQALARLRGRPEDAPDEPSAVVAAAQAGDAICLEAVSLFLALLARLAGDLALAFGAFGGVYLAGGVLDHLGGLFDPADFRRRMEDKGRYDAYLAEIPVWRLKRPDAAFLGLRRLLTAAT